MLTLEKEGRLNPYVFPETKFLVFCSQAKLTTDNCGRAALTPCRLYIGACLLSGFAYDNTVQFSPGSNLYASEKNLKFYTVTTCFTKYGYTQPKCPPVPRPVNLTPPIEGFLPDTLVATLFGSRKIASLEPGETVICFDSDNKKWTKTLVLAVNKSQKIDQIFKIKTHNGTINTTEYQKFYLLKSDSWVYTKDLKPKDLLLERIEDKDNAFNLN